jgi:hypothetical protein
MSLPSAIDLNAVAKTCLFANSIPKAGTHLLREFILQLNVWRFVGHVYDSSGEEAALSVFPPGWAGSVHHLPAADAIGLLTNGRCLTGHAVHTSAIDELLVASDSRDLRCITFIRDPRDVLISMTRYITTSRVFARQPRNLEIQNYLNTTFSAFEDKLSHVLQTTDLHQYSRYAGWLTAPQTRVIRFEDIGEECETLAADRDAPSPIMTDLLTFLQVDPTLHPPSFMVPLIWQRSHTASGQSFKPRRFEKVFEARHHQIFDERGGAASLSALGYS